MTDIPTFGITLARIREPRGLSQSALAELVDCDHSYISRIEAGKRAPGREIIERIIHALALERDDADALMAAAGFLPVSLAGMDWRDVAALLEAARRVSGVREERAA